MTSPFVEYFRCPHGIAQMDDAGPLLGPPGFFRFGDATCFGSQPMAEPSLNTRRPLADVSKNVSAVRNRVVLPFDLAEVVTNLHYERYPTGLATSLDLILDSNLAHGAYYFLRPVLPVRIRRPLQKLRLRGWRRIPFPQWPVDVTVESLMRTAMRLLLEKGDLRELPFIWFWPEGAPGCVMMTHDVEGPAGARFVDELIAMDEAFGVRSAFQLVPEAKTSRPLLEQCRRRGFEVNVHDFNHDGHLFRDRAQFEKRMAAINRYAREFGCDGFRSGAMYRRQDWFSVFEFAFDMSVPTVAHFEPQQGGCCTVMPHFIGDVLELPLTTTQDYALFHYLGDYSIELWKTQCDLICANNGLVSFIVHPDYVAGEARARRVYQELLEYLARLRADAHLWNASPGEVNRWWRNRREMRLVREGQGWRVEGPGSDRARVAYARLQDDGVVFEVEAAAS